MLTPQIPVGSGFDASTSTADVLTRSGNNLCALELDRRGRSDGIRGFSLHPGSIARHVSVADLHAMGLVDEAGARIVDPARNMKDVSRGAATNVWCATSAQLNGLGGVYCQNCDIAPLVVIPDDPDAAARQAEEIKGFGSLAIGVMPHSVDPDSAARLWDLSVRLTGTDV